MNLIGKTRPERKEDGRAKALPKMDPGLRRDNGLRRGWYLSSPSLSIGLSLIIVVLIVAVNGPGDAAQGAAD